jgi:hypothetical protein
MKVSIKIELIRIEREEAILRLSLVDPSTGGVELMYFGTSQVPIGGSLTGMCESLELIPIPIEPIPPLVNWAEVRDLGVTAPAPPPPDFVFPPMGALLKDLLRVEPEKEPIVEEKMEETKRLVIMDEEGEKDDTD